MEKISESVHEREGRHGAPNGRRRRLANAKEVAGEAEVHHGQEDEVPHQAGLHCVSQIQIIHAINPTANGRREPAG